MNEIIHKIIDLLKWIYRKRSVWSILLKSGCWLVGTSLAGGIIFQVSFFYADNERAVGIKLLGDSDPLWTLLALLILGVLLILTSVFVCLTEWKDNRRRKARELCLVVELHGLRQIPETPLLEFIEQGTSTRCQGIPIDLRESLYDGEITSPEIALEKVSTVSSRVIEAISQHSAQDVSMVFGGLAPVPYTFLAGLLLDDERGIEIVDWNRNQRKWSRLDQVDDGERFIISGLDKVSDSDTVALCVSLSYAIDADIIRRQFPEIDIVVMEHKGRSTDNHWSLLKQQALGKEFVDTVLSLAGHGVQNIELFLSAQMSMVFRLGGLYDKRNMPAIKVHQYEPGSPASYPWSVSMPVNGVREAKIVHARE